MEFTRRGFLRAVGIGGAGAAATVAAPLALKLAEGKTFGDCSSLERAILKAIEAKASKWPKDHLVHTIKDVDVITLKTQEVVLNCAAGTVRTGFEAFTVTFRPGLDPNEPEGRVAIEQQVYDLMIQIDRFGKPGWDHDRARFNRKRVGNRHELFTSRKLEEKVASMNAAISEAKRRSFEQFKRRGMNDDPSTKKLKRGNKIKDPSKNTIQDG